MSRKQLIEGILSTYDAEMTKKYGAWLKRQSKEVLIVIYNARMY